MTEITGWVLQVLVSSRSGKRRLYITGSWPDGKVRTSSATTILCADGEVQTHSGSTYLLKGTDRFGKTLAESLSACGEWIPAGQ